MQKVMTKKTYYTLSFLIPSMMILTIFLLFTIIPFGNRTWLTIDLGQQYVDFFSYYQDTLLHHPEQFFYSFSKSIGGEMVSLWAYYLLSPFNLLFLLIPRSAIAMSVSSYFLETRFLYSELCSIARCEIQTKKLDDASLCTLIRIYELSFSQSI